MNLNLTNTQSGNKVGLFYSTQATPSFGQSSSATSLPVWT